jgi:hypothetical protein
VRQLHAYGSKVLCQDNWQQLWVMDMDTFIWTAVSPKIEARCLNSDQSCNVQLVVARQIGTLEYEVGAGIIYAVFEGRPGIAGHDMPGFGMNQLKQPVDFKSARFSSRTEIHLKNHPTFPITVLMEVSQ